MVSADAPAVDISGRHTQSTPINAAAPPQSFSPAPISPSALTASLSPSWFLGATRLTPSHRGMRREM